MTNVRIIEQTPLISFRTTSRSPVSAALGLFEIECPPSQFYLSLHHNRYEKSCLNLRRDGYQPNDAVANAKNPEFVMVPALDIDGNAPEMLVPVCETPVTQPTKFTFTCKRITRMSGSAECNTDLCDTLEAFTFAQISLDH